MSQNADFSKGSSTTGPISKSLKSLYIVGAAVFLSGFAALTYEIVWQRVLVRVIGATTPAISVIVCAFMGGLALGGLAGSWLSRKSKNQLKLLAMLELLTGVAGLISIAVCQTEFVQTLTTLLSGTAGDGTTFAAAGFLMIFLLVFIPTSLMGATLPVIAGYLEREHSGHVQLLQRFYAINASGAVFGAFSAGFFLLPLMGISQTLSSTAGVNFVAAAFIFWAAQAGGKTEPVQPSGTADNEPVVSSRPRILLAASLVLFTSALSFTMEMVWSRYLVFLFGSSTYALSLVLSVFIAGLSIGAWLAASLAPHIRSQRLALSTVLALTSISISLNLFQFQAAPAFFLSLKKFVFDSVGTGFWFDSIVMLVSAVSLILLPSILIGILFPLLLGSAGKAGNNLARSTAVLYCASVIGSMLGSFVGGVVLLPAMARQFTSGIESTTMIISICYLGACVAALLGQTNAVMSAPGRNTAILICVSLALIGLRPPWNAALTSGGLAYVSKEDLDAIPVSSLVDILSLKDSGVSGARKLLMYREGANSTISVTEDKNANLLFLKNNGKTEASIPIDPALPAPGSDLPTQKLLGLVPAIECPGENLEGLLIGYGSGTTCGAILSAPWVKRLVVVELEEAVWAARRFFWTAEQNSKMQKVTADARNYLSLSDDKFDFIVSQPVEPWLSGASDLFTIEFYQLAKSRLKDSGLFCQWVPLYSLTPDQLSCLLQTFESVYPECSIWHPVRAGELILMGRLSGKKLERGLMQHRISEPDINTQLQRIGIEDQFSFESNELNFPQPEKRTGLINTDDNLLVECRLAMEMSSSKTDIDASLRQVIGPEKFKRRSPESDHSNLTLAKDWLAYWRHRAPSDQFASDSFYFAAIKGEKVPVPPPELSFITKPAKDPPELEEMRARFLLHMGDGKQAAAVVRAIGLSTFTDYAELCDLGAIQFMSGEPAAALTTFHQAGELEPKGARAKAGIGLCHWVSKNWTEAVAPLAESLKIDPNQFLARYALAQILLKEGKEIEALTDMRSAGQVHPDSPWPGLFVASYFIEKNNWQLASTNLHLAMRRKQHVPEAVALGFLISTKTNNQAQCQNFRYRYREITAGDINIDEAYHLVKTILSEPYITGEL